MSLLESLIKGVFVFGLCYLQGIVLFALLTIDCLNDDEKRAAHYKSRKQTSAGYRFVPVACICLTSGVLGNIWIRSGDWVSLAQLGIAFATAFNNGTNVVDPANSLSGENPTTSKPNNEAAVLSRIKKGHLLDALGFTLVSIGLLL